MAKLLEIIKLQGMDLMEGETRRMPCPRCHESEGYVLTKKDDGALVWICHRAKCDLEPGCLPSSGSRHFQKAEGTVALQETPQLPVFDERLVPLRDHQYELLDQKFGLSRQVLQSSVVRYAPRVDRVAFGIMGYLGNLRGWVLRDIGGSAQIKAITRRIVPKPEPLISWAVSDRNVNTAIVVEDIPSGLRGSKWFTAAAILSGGIGPSYAEELASRARHVIWALDNDNRIGSIHCHRKYGGWFQSSRVLSIPKDLKDMTEEELDDTLGELA